ncbi:hypothetical protein ACHAXR_002161 [Thalassiosira sp. AJA248-18]
MGEKTDAVKEGGKKFFEKMFVPANQQQANADNAPTGVGAQGHGKKPSGASTKPSTKPATKPNAKPAASKKSGFTAQEAKYKDAPWSKLPLSARKAAKVIGFEQQKWDDKEWVPIDGKHWRDLTPEEKKACGTLGWDEVSWESKYPTKPNAKPAASKKSGFTDKEAKYEDVPWSKLPLPARKAAKAIGFGEQSWDDKEWLHIDDKHWWDLTLEEKKACETLGWDEVSWESKYENQWWADLPKHVQKAAEKLGWNQENWDGDWDTPTWHKGWEEFSDEEKRCLHVLGYYVHTW